MSKSNTTENDLLLLYFQKTLPAYLGTLATTGNASLYVALHTADPTDTGTQTSFEADYTNYARVGVARTSDGWTVSGNQAKNTAQIAFSQCQGGTNVITHVSIGMSDTPTAGQILYCGELNDDLTVSNLIQPIFDALALVVEED